MNGTVYIGIGGGDVYLEVDYDYTPEQDTNDYDQPPDAASTEIEKVTLHGVHDGMDISSFIDELSHALKWETVEEHVQQHIQE